MIAKLTGTIDQVQGGHVVLDVHGVGYLLAVRSTLDFMPGQEASLYTYLAVRENALDLYGFLLAEERSFFEELIKLPKIGPKSAMQILVQAEVSLLRKAIVEQDPVYLSKMSGIGKKTAEKIVSELKDVFEDEIISTSPNESSNTDIIDALMALGYTQKDARDALQKIAPGITDTQERIKQALKFMRLS